MRARVHYVDGPLDGCTDMLSGDNFGRHIRVPYMGQVDAVKWGMTNEPALSAPFQELTYAYSGVETRWGTRVYIFEP